MYIDKFSLVLLYEPQNYYNMNGYKNNAILQK